MEMPTKDKSRQFHPTKGDLGETVRMKEAEVALHNQVTDVFVGFTDAMAVKYANKLEEDGKKQAMIDAYNNSKEGKKQPIEHDGFTTFSRGYENMSKKIYANQLKMETDQTITNFTREYEADPIEFGKQIQMYMQETEGTIPEEMRESWRQEVVGNSTLALNKLKDQHEAKLREQYSASFVNVARSLELQGLDYADSKVEGMIDKNIAEYDTMIEQAVADKIMTPAKGEQLKLGHRAGIGETYVMSAFQDALDTDLNSAVEFQREFSEASTLGKRTGGSRAWRNRNPGNIKFGKFAKGAGAIGVDKGGFAIFPSDKVGQEAQSSLLRGRSYKNLDMIGMVNRYAPASDNNNTVAYVNSLIKQTGIHPGKKMGDLTQTEMDNLTLAMRHHEGWTEGTSDSPWEYTTEERDAMASKMGTMIKSKQTALNSGRSAMKSVNNRSLKDAVKILEDGGDITNKSDLEVLNVDDASYENVMNYKLASNFSPAIKAFNQDTLLDQDAEIKKLQSKKERTPEEQYILDTFEKLYAKNQSEIENDPVGYFSTKVSKDSFVPLSPGTVGQKLKSTKTDLEKRLPVAQGIEGHLNRSKEFYTDAEATEIAGYFLNELTDYKEVVTYAGDVIEAVGEDSLFVFDQLSEKDATEVAMIGNLSYRLNYMEDKDAGPTIANVIEGAQILKADPGVKPSDLERSIAEMQGNVFYGMTPKEQSMYTDAIQSYVVADMRRDGKLGIDSPNYSESLKKAFHAMIGGEPIKIGNQTIMPPWKGATRADFSDKIETFSDTSMDQLERLSPSKQKQVIAEMKKGVDDGWIFKSNPSMYSYRSEGNGKYKLVEKRNGLYVQNEDGSPLTITITKD